MLEGLRSLRTFGTGFCLDGTDFDEFAAQRADFAFGEIGLRLGQSSALDSCRHVGGSTAAPGRRIAEVFEVGAQPIGDCMPST